MKKMFILPFILCLLVCLSCTVGAASLSPAVDVLAHKLIMVKTGVGVNSVSFDKSDFESFFGTELVSSVKLSSVPDGNLGKLMLGENEVSEGDIISPGMVNALRFVPASAGVNVSFGFIKDDGYYSEPFECRLTMLEALDFSPKAEDISVSAFEDVSYSGVLTASDPENDALTFKIVKQPKHGTVTVDEKTGAYVYTPKSSYSGKDSFLYVAEDCFSNVSDKAKVNIEVAGNKYGIVYKDMENNPSHTAAVALGEKEIIIGEMLGGERLFYPEKTVSRAEFLIMAMKASGLYDSIAETPEKTGFADEDNMSEYEKTYIGKAAAAGIVVGCDTEKGRCFLPDDMITYTQAATVISRIATYSGKPLSEDIPTLADIKGEITKDGMEAMETLGFMKSGTNGDDKITRAAAADMMYTLLNKKKN